jgi:hypothetical protein
MGKRKASSTIDGKTLTQLLLKYNYEMIRRRILNEKKQKR